MATSPHAQRAHALLSASGASRWINCTPSARLEEPIKNTSSVYALEGTFAHELAELGLKEHIYGGRATLMGKWCIAKRRELEANELYSDEMQEHINFYCDYIIERLAEYKDAQLLIEEQINLSNIIEGGFGTNDAVIIANGRIIVIDLKYGAGVPVSANDNSQLKLYAYGSFKANDLNYELDENTTVELVIIQPRRDHVSTYELTAAELIEWAEITVKEKAAQAYAGEGDCIPGKWCNFCRFAPQCRALADKCTEDVRADFAEQAKTLTPDEIAALLDKRDLINSWMNALGAYALSEALAGREWPNYKLVMAKHQSRKWADEELVAKKLEENGFTDIYKTSLYGIGAIEKLVGKKELLTILGDLIVKPEGAPTLAPANDKRPALSINVADDFKE